jgi:DNA-binding transcriptional MerR regulator
MTQSETPKIPDKLYFRINDVAEITGLAPYILRYWESEFPMLRPERDEKGERRYRKSDIELILQIKKLVYEEKYTLAGACKQLKAMRRRNSSGGGTSAAAGADAKEAPDVADAPPAPADPVRMRELAQAVAQLRDELTAVYRLLSN